ncbi:MAG: AmmeMemoRadiSam system protein B [Anaerolineae bacterium]|nr:AmmeMemoRadiSam system protein B [Anaerolineae bacterium]
MLQDPLQISQRVIVLPYRLAPFLSLCDGTRDLDGLRASLAVRGGLYLTTSELEHLVQQLDEALMLDNERFALAREQALAEYRAAPHRRPALANASYPADAEALRAYFDQLMSQVSQDGPADPRIRAVISPHIDYQRGGPVYARTWAQAAAAAAQADLAVIFGTDHSGGGGTHHAHTSVVCDTLRRVAYRSGNRGYVGGGYRSGGSLCGRVASPQ